MLINAYKPTHLMLDCEPGPILILARHGNTESNDATEEKVRGWDNLDLDNKGRTEAQLLSIRMKVYNPKDIVCSDFARDEETAAIISKYLNIPYNIDVSARTLDTGIFSGKPLKDVNPAIENVYKHPWMSLPGASESFNEFSARFIEFLEKRLKRACIDIFRPSVLITHGKNIAMAQNYIEGGNAWECEMPMPAHMAVIEVNDDRSLSIKMEQPTENVIEDR